MRYLSNHRYRNFVDADSLLLPEYTLRLVNKMHRPVTSELLSCKHPTVLFRGARFLEHIAGATTDSVSDSQGFTHSAQRLGWRQRVAPLSALEDIKSHDHERDYPIVRYIQDRTVSKIPNRQSISLSAAGVCITIRRD